MAGVLVDVLLERLATLALDKIERELKLVVEVKQKVENLTLKLEAIRAVLEDAEQRQEGEANVKLWLNQLNDVSYDMDDVLDEWITRVLTHQLEKQEKQTANAVVAAKKKVCFPFPSSCFRFSQVNQLFLRREIALKIEELNEKLALIDERKQSFGFQNITRAVPQLPQRQKTTSSPDVKTFGRENEKNLVVSKLLGESREASEVPLIIPIVGMGGMGKTSLANLVYNDEKIKNHFDNHIWVCVSDPFEDVKIAKAIVEGLGADNTSNELEHLMKKIIESIKGKKFLLVLDDVWSPKLSQWEELVKALRNGDMGSRVLVTTRKEEVVTLMKATTHLIPLKELGEKFCLSLFYYNADVDESRVSGEFLDIGSKIVKRCNGLPLAAKTLGRLMQNKKKIHEWRAIFYSKTWDLKEIQQDVFRPLLLSYHDLDPAIRHCLLYCVLFPKDYTYNKTALIELWMSQDYLNVNESKNKEIIGQSYFDDLVNRSFFQDVEVNDKERYTSCKIHDIIHDFLQYLTKNECLILDDGEIKEVLNDKVHHLTIVDATHSDSVVSFLFKCKRLRTFTVIEWSNSFIGPMLESIVQLKSLRTLNLCQQGGHQRSLVEIPDTIGELIHLRYLDLSGNDMLKELPSTMGSLYNLQTLRLVGCWRVKEVDVGRLINLRHIHVKGCGLLWLIKGIERLTQLQRLDEFRVQDGADEGNKLEHLKDLNQLQGSLTIHIQGCPDMVENAAILVNKPHLLELRLEFYESVRFFVGYAEVKKREIMDGLEPQPALESLFIYGYKGSAFSHWFSSLYSLRVLTLSNCRYCNILPPLGKLAFLESLHIQRLDGVSKVGVEFLGREEGQISSSSISISFPNLKQLTIQGMDSWEEWEGVEEEKSESTTIMSCLEQFTIWNCKKLKALPHFLWNTPLQKLHISDSPILQMLYRKGTGEEWAKISHITSITIR